MRRLVFDWCLAELLVSRSARKEGRANSCKLLLYVNTSDLHGTKSILSVGFSGTAWHFSSEI